MNVDSLQKGLVIDHIQAGKSMEIYRFLDLDRMDFSVAIIKNARIGKSGKKEIIKIEDKIDVDLDVLGFIDPNITVNVVEGGRITRKRKLQLPAQVTNVAKCKNPRCITSIEQELPHIFKLSEEGDRRVYRCIYCEQEYNSKK